MTQKKYVDDMQMTCRHCKCNNHLSQTRIVNKFGLSPLTIMIFLIAYRYSLSNSNMPT